jgi:putative glutamine amidotransferase
VRPVVGITAWPASIAEEHAAVPVQAVPDDYLVMLEAVGLSALLIPVTGSAPSAADLASRIDGLLLTGGGDVAPARYAAAQQAQTAGVDTKRDEVEIELVRLAFDLGLPILAVCRGIQLLNVALGGTLVQDLPTADPPSPGHMELEHWNAAAHAVRLEPGTLLHRLLGPEISVNSLHHQAVGSTAPGLRVAARAPDGVIEAVEDRGTRFVVGLQWHPEMLGPGHASSAVFRQFAEAAGVAPGRPLSPKSRPAGRCG